MVISEVWPHAASFFFVAAARSNARRRAKSEQGILGPLHESYLIMHLYMQVFLIFPQNEYPKIYFVSFITISFDHPTTFEMCYAQ